MRTKLMTHLDFLLCAALLSTTVRTAASPPVLRTAEGTVELTGWLHVEDLTMADVVLEVEVNGTVQVAHVAENGRFTVLLPADAEAVLHFEKPGHLPKDVVVDTRHAQEGELGQKLRRVRFAVIMELERRMGGLTYAGPVGTIGFEAGGGCVAVAHDRRRVPAQRRTPMVF